MADLPELSLVPLLGVKVETGNGPKIVTFPVLNAPAVDARDVSDFGNFASLFLKTGNDVTMTKHHPAPAAVGFLPLVSTAISPPIAASGGNSHNNIFNNLSPKTTSGSTNNNSSNMSPQNGGLNSDYVINWDMLGEIQRQQNECISLISKATVANNPGDPSNQDDPMFCDICGDRATGLHYGIISCEGYVLNFPIFPSFQSFPISRISNDKIFGYFC